MLRAQCDICGDDCNVQSTTRRWENIIGELGLEIVILKGDKPVGDVHVCDNCSLEMFWKKVGRNNESPTRQLQEELSAREANCRKWERELEQKSNKVEVLFQEFYVKKNELEAMDLKLKTLQARSDAMEKLRIEQNATEGLRRSRKTNF